MFFRRKTTPIGKPRGRGTGDGGGVVSGLIPSYNSGVMTETILHPTSSLDGLLERLPPEPHPRGEEFERAAKWFLETDLGYAL